MKKQNIIFILYIVFFVVALSVPALWIGGFFDPPINESKMDKLFVEDYEVLADISDYLTESEIMDVYISLSQDEAMPIDNAAVLEMIDKLKNKGYKIIEKNNDTISFLRWSNLDAGRGFVYSINGNVPELQFLTYLKELPKVNWYYYEEDFNEWKLQNEQ